MPFTNKHDIGLPLAVWLAADGYDFTPNEYAISVTSLLKPIRQTILGRRLTPETQETPDVSDMIAARLGHSLHDGIERAWKYDYKAALKKLGYPDKTVEMIEINPETAKNSHIPVYLEQRAERECMGYTISGKFDMILDGGINDFKSTSAYTWIHDTKREDYIIQGSCYRWLNPEKVTRDEMAIQFIFTDWSKAQSKANPNYPQQRVVSQKYPLWSLEKTENWIKERITLLERSKALPESELPMCTDKELWRGDTLYKYFSDPSKTTGRSTKNFTDKLQANLFMREKGKGVVIEVPGKVKACSYCAAFPICSQKDAYDHE